jgi:signal transduction histidine kinase/CheY-like chemotaxis protein
MIDNDKLRILLVDDNPDDVEIIARLLEREFPGVEIEKSSAPEQFDRALERGRFNLVVTDFQLQWGDGLGVLRAVKERFPYRPVIMFTATGTQEVAVEAMKSGLDDYIIKSPKHYVRLLSSVRAVLQRTETERRAADLQMRLDHLLGWINIGVFRAEPGGRLLECNAAFLRLLGAESLEAAQDLFAREFAAGMVVDKSPLDKSVMSPAREVRVPFPDGDRWFLVEEVVVITSAGRQLVDGLAEDITERKMVEKKIQAAYEREADARAEAERLSRIKDEFLATLSHELRTPLNVISGWAQYLQGGDLDAGEIAQALETIRRNIRAQTQIIDDLMDVSAIIMGKLRLSTQDVDADECLRGSLAAMRPAAEAKGIDLEYLPDPGPIFVRADPARMQQIAWNLLSNAIKFTDSGGRVELRLKRDGGQVVISVRDTGRGIAPDFLPLVFDRFSQADSSISRSHGGLGLGLAIVRHLAEIHGGGVKAESAGEGRGATFTVRLPNAIPQPSAREGARQVGVARTAILEDLKVLLVDDSIESCNLIEMMLSQRGAQVNSLNSGLEALTRLESELPDLLIFDIAMPGLDGYELLMRVREVGINIPAIALTALARTEDRVRALAVGFQWYLSKPVDAEELVMAAASLCGRLDQSSEADRE